MRMGLLSIVIAGLGVAFVAAADDAQKDKAKLQGTWNVTKVEARGQAKDDNENHQLIFAGDELTVKQGDDLKIKAKIKLDATKKPMQIDVEIFESPKEELKGKTGLGIYMFDGDTLKLCINQPGEAERPKEFSAQLDTKSIVLTCQKQK